MTRMDTQNAFFTDTITSYLTLLSLPMANSRFPLHGITHSVCGTSTLARPREDSSAIPLMFYLLVSVLTTGKSSLVPATGRLNFGTLLESANMISKRMVMNNGTCSIVRDKTFGLWPFYGVGYPVYDSAQMSWIPWSFPADGTRLWRWAHRFPYCLFFFDMMYSKYICYFGGHGPMRQFFSTKISDPHCFHLSPVATSPLYAILTSLARSGNFQNLNSKPITMVTLAILTPSLSHPTALLPLPGVKMVSPCCGIWMRASTSTRSRRATSSTLSYSRLIDTGSARRQLAVSRFSIWRASQ